MCREIVRSGQSNILLHYGLKPDITAKLVVFNQFKFCKHFIVWTVK